MNRLDFQKRIVVKTLNKIPNGYSTNAVLALMMIVAHESLRGKYRIQKGCGTAKSLYQIEEVTYDTVWKYGQSCFKNALTLGFITDEQYKNKEYPEFDRIILDDEFATFIARQRLFMKPEALPVDPHAMSVYLKKHWNSAGGAADGMSYKRDYDIWLEQDRKS